MSESTNSAEWTVEQVKNLVGHQARRIDYSEIAQRIADAHNRALAEAREDTARLDWLQSNWNVFLHEDSQAEPDLRIPSTPPEACSLPIITFTVLQET